MFLLLVLEADISFKKKFNIEDLIYFNNEIIFEEFILKNFVKY